MKKIFSVSDQPQSYKPKLKSLYAVKQGKEKLTLNTTLQTLLTEIHNGALGRLMKNWLDLTASAQEGKRRIRKRRQVKQLRTNTGKTTTNGSGWTGDE